MVVDTSQTLPTPLPVLAAPNSAGSSPRDKKSLEQEKPPKKKGDQPKLAKASNEGKPINKEGYDPKKYVKVGAKIFRKKKPSAERSLHQRQADNWQSHAREVIKSFGRDRVDPNEGPKQKSAVYQLRLSRAYAQLIRLFERAGYEPPVVGDFRIWAEHVVPTLESLLETLSAGGITPHFFDCSKNFLTEEEARRCGVGHRFLRWPKEQFLRGFCRKAYKKALSDEKFSSNRDIYVDVPDSLMRILRPNVTYTNEGVFAETALAEAGTGNESDWDSGRKSPQQDE